MENILFVLFLLKKDVICTEIIIFATEIRKPWPYDPNGSPNKRGRSLNNYYEFSMAAPVFYCCMVKMLEWERLRKMGTVAGTVAKKLRPVRLNPPYQLAIR